MLKNAQSYKSELQRKYQETIYDIDYQYFHCSFGSVPLMVPDRTFDSHCFVSVDKKDNIIGYIGYVVDYAARRVSEYGIISFDKGNLEFTKDVLQSIDDIFRKYKMSSLTFSCFTDNPIMPTYTKLVEKYNGRVVGVFNNCAVLLDGKLHNSVHYEMTLWGYISAKEGFKNV